MTPLNTERYLIPVLGTGLMFFEFGKYWSAHWFSKWLYLVAVASLVLTYFAARRTHWSLAPFGMVVSASAICFGFWVAGGYIEQYPKALIFAINKTALWGYFVYVMAVSFIVFLPASFKRSVELFLHIVFWLSALATIWRWFGPQPLRGVFSGNPSMNGCLIACLMPFVFDRTRCPWTRFFIVLCALMAVVAVESSTPLGVFLIVSIWLVLHRYRSMPIVIVASMFGAAALFGLAEATQGMQSLLGDGRRMELWGHAYEWWARVPNPWFGAGLGTAQSLFPTVMYHVYGGAPPSYLLWMHNEWFQILWELGVLGLVTVVPVVCFFLWHSRRDVGLSAILLGSSAAGLLVYPLRLPIHATVIVCTLWLVLLERDKLRSHIKL